MKAKVKMFLFSGCAAPLRLQAATLSVLVASIVFVSAASAVDLDFNVPNGNYNVAGNWIESATGNPAGSAPTTADRAFVRNNGTMLINSNVASLEMRIGYHNNVTAPDYNGDGFVDAADYVAWRKGGTLLNDATPASVGPNDYAVWRTLFGSAAGTYNIGMPGTLNWTAGEITGAYPDPDTPGDLFSGGPDIRVGRIELVNGVPTEVRGTVVQNGPTTKLLLPYESSQLDIGDGTSFSNTPTSSYTLADGTIGLAIGNDFYNPDGTNGNAGIYVRNGSFTMTGGQIIDATPAEYFVIEPGGTNYFAALRTQRFLFVGDVGGAEGNEGVGTATLSGGNIDVLGGIRVADANHARGYLNINGPVTIKTGGDTQIGSQSNGVNTIGEMNMSAGSLQVGRNVIHPVTGAIRDLTGRLHIGDGSPGFLNMSGGSIDVTRELVVGNNQAAAGSALTMTGGTITTGGLNMRRNSAISDTIGGDFAASIILNGPTASFTTTGLGASTSILIGNFGEAKFEVIQGHATLGANPTPGATVGITTQLGANATSAATLNVSGGRLTLLGPLGRSNTASAAPVINLTGGILEFSQTASGQLWQTNFTNTGSQLITKAGALHQVTVGDAAHSSDFSMTGGSWDLEIGANGSTGSDRFIVNDTIADLETASLTGGTLNISYVLGYSPVVGHKVRILQAPDGVTLTAGAVTLAGQSGWQLITDLTSTPQIMLEYIGGGAGGGVVPEPSTIMLVGLFASMAMASRKARCRKP